MIGLYFSNDFIGGRIIMKKLINKNLATRFTKKILLVFISTFSVTSFSANTSSVMSTFSYQDTMADTVYQQIVNGTYRTVELLDLLAN